MEQTRQQKFKKVVKSLEEWAAKILCQDNNYVENLANTDKETKKMLPKD
jgi:hypothetical protein